MRPIPTRRIQHWYRYTVINNRAFQPVLLTILALVLGLAVSYAFVYFLG